MASPWTECPTLSVPLDADARTAAGSIPEALLEPARRLLAAVRAGLPPSARPLADMARARTRDRFQPELEALASRLGVEWRDLLLANLIYDLTLARIGCSTVALATPSGPVLGRNMDWWPEDLLARASTLTRWTRGGSTAFAAGGWPGAIGVVSGLSARGFALVLNAVNAVEPSNPRGYPMLLFLRTVLEDATDFGQALALVRDTPLTSPGLITLVGTRNDERVVIERTPTRARVRSADGAAPLIATNEYRAFAEAASPLGTAVAPPPNAPPSTQVLRISACARFDALTGATAGVTDARDIPDAELLYWLTDPGVQQTITAQHVLMRPAQGTVRLFVPSRLLGGLPGPDGR